VLWTIPVVVETLIFALHMYILQINNIYTEKYDCVNVKLVCDPS
jgi:hypothetical protein